MPREQDSNPTRDCINCNRKNIMTRRIQDEEDAETTTDNLRTTQDKEVDLNAGDEICIFCQMKAGEIELQQKTPQGFQNTLHPDVENQMWQNTKLPDDDEIKEHREKLTA